MKAVIILCVTFLVAVTFARPDGYTTKYDNINLDDIMGNKAVLKSYVHCVLDKGKCAPDAKALKDIIQDALETECTKCNDKQKDGTRRVIKHLVNNEPEYWKELSDKYDPDRKYTTKYEKEFKEVTSS